MIAEVNRNELFTIITTFKYFPGKFFFWDFSKHFGNLKFIKKITKNFELI